jgi:aromatic ring-cleaving dioxygenase
VTLQHQGKEKMHGLFRDRVDLDHDPVAVNAAATVAHIVTERIDAIDVGNLHEGTVGPEVQRA